MRIMDLIEMCFRNLFRRKVRTILTVTGVVIGTCAIIVTISLGVGLKVSQTAALEQMQDLTLIEIYNYRYGGGDDENAPPKLTDEVMAYLKSIPHVKAATPHIGMPWEFAEISASKYIYNGSITGVYMDEIQKFGYELASGSFTAPDAPPKMTILVGSHASYNFTNPKRPNEWYSPYPDENGVIQPPPVNLLAVKLALKVKKNKFDENGNLIWEDPFKPSEESSSGSSSSNVQSESISKEYKLTAAGILKENRDWGANYSIYVDLALIDEVKEQYNKINNIKPNKENEANNNGYEYVKVKADDMNNVAAIEEKIRELGYDTYSFEQIRKPMEEQARQTQLILGALGGISLLVAALGITNTMIMSIYERTREIGVMKVLGCPGPDIKTSFLMEAGCIGFIGGIVGILASYAMSFIMNNFEAIAALLGIGGKGSDNGYYYGGGLFGSFGHGNTISIIPMWLVGLGLVFAVFVGLASGYYPANRAIKISALSAINN